MDGCDYDFDVGEESSEVIGDVNGVILFYRFLYVTKPSPIVSLVRKSEGQA